MTTLPLHARNGHLFLEVEGSLWLVDTGAPAGFGVTGRIALAGTEFALNDSYVGVDAGSLSSYVGVPCVGLLGADMLGNFDMLLDVPGGTASLSTVPITMNGCAVPLEFFMGIPIVTAEIDGAACRMFLDTGAQISYWQDGNLSSFPALGTMEDFYPMIGKFITSTHQVSLRLAGMPMEMRFGTLPDMLAMTLMMAGTQGILGNEIFLGRRACYRPRDGELILA